MNIDLNYVIKLRRELHRFPEVGLDLDKTLVIIRRELDAMEIPYTEEFGKASIVATINPNCKGKVIGLRADTDALPVTEETGLPFASEHPGKMHACGHDCHTAMLLGAGKALKEMEKDLKCSVKLVFQAAEEGPGGAKLMCDDGLMDGIDMIIGCHISPAHKARTVWLNKTCMNASSHGFKIYLNGKSSHAARPHLGVDAIAMAARIYTDLQIMRAREINPFDPVILGIGEIHGGKANNVVCDNVMMHGTIRALTPEMDEYLFRRVNEISQCVAKDMGGSCQVETTKYYPCLCNDHGVADKIVAAAQKYLPEGSILERDKSMGAEDFAYYSLYKPAAMFTLGCNPNADNSPAAPLHNGKMMVDENSLDIAPAIFVQFVLDNME